MPGKAKAYRSAPNGIPEPGADRSPDTKTLTTQLRGFPEPVTPPDRVEQSEDSDSAGSSDEERSAQERQGELDSEEESTMDFKKRMQNLEVQIIKHSTAKVPD